MKESGYYPPGAEFDPNAPYNEPLTKNYDVSISLSFTLNAEDRQSAWEELGDITDALERFLNTRDVDDIILDDVCIL